MQADCRYRPECPGCPRFGDMEPAAAALGDLRQFCQQVGAPAPCCVVGPGLGSRFRARLAVRGSSARPHIGIFRAGTHRVVDIPECAVHHPLINETAQVVKASMLRHGLPPYHELTGRGLVRYLQLVVARQSQQIQLVVVANRETPAALATWFSELAANPAARLHSLWFNGNVSRGNTIFGERWQRMFGPEALIEEIAGASVYYPPGAFGQSNLPLAEQLAVQVGAWLPAGQRVVEYYSGVGAIGLGLLTKSRSVAFNEIAEHSLRGLELGLNALPAALRAKAQVLAGPAAAFAAQSAAADVVIVDPPRKGLCRELLQQLLERPPSTLIYVSCGLPAFLRDARALLEQARMALVEVSAYDLFPFTEHVETLARFERR